MRSKLENWLSKNFCPLIETTGTIVCDINVSTNNKKRKIAIGFSRYHQVSEPWEYVIPKRGYVLMCPSFWLSIPKELVIPYIEDYIDGYMDDYIYADKDEVQPNPPSGGCPNIPPCHHPPIHSHPPIMPPPCITSSTESQEVMNNFNTSQLESLSGSGCLVGCENGDCENKNIINVGSKFNNVTNYFTNDSEK